jgi:hypothetical protein
MAIPGARRPRALTVSLGFPDAEAPRRLGQDGYGAHFLRRAFAPLLERFGRVGEVTRPESRLDYALWRARRDGFDPVHLSFLPLHQTYLTGQAPNVGYVVGEFPDLPDGSDGNPRHNWARIANRHALLLTPSAFTRDALARAGVTTPVEVVPVPVHPDYFDMPAWQLDGRHKIDCPAYVFPQGSPATPTKPGRRRRAQALVGRWLRPCVPGPVRTALALAVKARRAARAERVRRAGVPHAACPALETTGVVYTSVFNPLDDRKNWQDLVSAFLRALGGAEDAMLVLKLAVCPEEAALGVNTVLEHYYRLGIPHRCKLAVTAGYLADAQMVELARASTFYVSAARAEGVCLPLQDLLAAGRPGIAPVHTGLAEYFHEGVGFVVASYLEPAHRPGRLGPRSATLWHRPVWQSLHDQLRASYETARSDPAAYRSMAARARRQTADRAGRPRVAPRLASALEKGLDRAMDVARAEP